MSDTAIIISFPNVSASTFTPNILATKYVQDVVASSNSAGVLVSAQPAGFPAVPGLYKRVGDVINSLVFNNNILLNVEKRYTNTVNAISSMVWNINLYSEIASYYATVSYLEKLFGRLTNSTFTVPSVAFTNTSQVYSAQNTLVESKDAFTSSYFQDLTYTAPTQYVGTLTLI